MRLHLFPSAALLLTVSAPALADAYLFDGRAWIAGGQTDSHSRVRAESATSENSRERGANPVMVNRATTISIIREDHNNTWSPWQDQKLRTAP